MNVLDSMEKNVSDDEMRNEKKVFEASYICKYMMIEIRRSIEVGPG